MSGPPSEVFLADISVKDAVGVLEKIPLLLRKIGLGDEDLDSRLVAVKMHFGEKGNTAFIRPLYIARIVSFIAGAGGRAYLTDTNTLYVGSRADSASHFMTAVANGFDPSVIGAPVIIGGGIRGTQGIAVPVSGRHFREVEIAPEILEADIILGAAHFKGHEMSGFGGTLKNFGMGSASRRGKLAMHSRVKPYVHLESCTGCRRCDRWCAQSAISFHGTHAVIDQERCVGCGACLPVCPQGAIRIVWDEQTADMQEKMAEYAWGALKNHLPERAFFLNFILQVSPMCDCYPFAGAPIVPDLGILASRDPVAIDQASVDLVNAARGVDGPSLPEDGRPPGADKFRAVHPRVNWEIQLRHAEELGLGQRRYTLARV